MVASVTSPAARRALNSLYGIVRTRNPLSASCQAHSISKAITAYRISVGRGRVGGDEDWNGSEGGSFRSFPPDQSLKRIISHSPEELPHRVANIRRILDLGNIPDGEKKRAEGHLRCLAS